MKLWKKVNRKAILELFLIIILLFLSFVYFSEVIIPADKIIIHGDYRYGLTVWQHIVYHLKGLYVHSPKLPILAVLYLMSNIFGDIVAEKLFTVFILFLSSLFVYISHKHFLRKIFKKSLYWQVSISAFVGTLVFLYNPWTINKIHHHYWLVLSLTSSYFLLAEIDKFIHSEKSSFPRILLISCLLTITATQVQSLILYAGFMFILYMLCFTVFERKEFLEKFMNKKTVIAVSIMLLLNSFWILPQILTLLSGISKPGGYGIVVENVDILSRRVILLNVFDATNAFIWGGIGRSSTVHYDTILYGINVWRIISYIPFLMAISSLLFIKSFKRKEKEYALYFAMLLVTSILFSTGSYYPYFGDIYRKIFLDTGLGWIIRDPYKNTGLFILSLGFLISTIAHIILSKNIKNSIKLPTLILIISSIVIWGWPALTGDLNGHLKPYLVEYPKDLEKTIDYLEEHSDYRHNVLWYPPKTESVYFTYHDVPQISTSSLNTITMENEELVKYLENNLKKNDRAEMLQLLNKMGVKYIILRHDLIESNQKKRLLNDIQAFENLFRNYKKVEFGNFTIYEIKNPNHIIETCSLVSYSTSPNLNKDYKFNNTVQYVYFGGFYIIGDYLLLSSFDDYLIKVKSEHHNPGKCWSIGTFAGGWLKKFVPYLEKFGLENWQCDYGYGLVFTWAKNTTLEIQFNVEKTDNYKLFIRYFKNQQGGTIKIKINNKTITLNTKNQLNKFVWEDLGNLYLKKGKHNLILENIDGFNAVNLFTLVPQKEYIKTKREVERLIQNKTIIYLFEAESDLYRGNTKVPNVIFEKGCLFGTPPIVDDPELSNGEGLEFYPDSKAWQSIDIVKEGYYRIGLKLKGDFEVKIDNFSFDIHSFSLALKYTPPFYLKKGKHYLQIIPKSYKSLLDIVYLFSVPDRNLNVTLKDIFESKDIPAKIEEYKKVNPTLWKVKINAQRPFMLSFAESYDPLWEARIYKNGQKIKTVKSIPLYSVINGFWIDESGDLEIVIRYKPQDWFEMGLAISALTFIGYIGYLFYDWRRNKTLSGR